MLLKERASPSSPGNASLTQKVADAIGEGDGCLKSTPQRSSLSSAPRTSSSMAPDHNTKPSPAQGSHKISPSLIPRLRLRSNIQGGTVSSSKTQHKNVDGATNADKKTCATGYIDGPPFALTATPDPWMQVAKESASSSIFPKSSYQQSLNSLALSRDITNTGSSPSVPEDTDAMSVRSTMSTGGRLSRFAERFKDDPHHRLSPFSPIVKPRTDYAGYWKARREASMSPNVYTMLDSELYDPRYASAPPSSFGRDEEEELIPSRIDEFADSQVQDSRDRMCRTAPQTLDTHNTSGEQNESGIVSHDVNHSSSSESDGDWEKVDIAPSTDNTGPIELLPSDAPHKFGSGTISGKDKGSYSESFQTRSKERSERLNNTSLTVSLLDLILPSIQSEISTVSPPRTLSLSSTESDGSFSPVRNSTVPSLSPYVQGGSCSIPPPHNARTMHAENQETQVPLDDNLAFMPPQKVFSQEPTAEDPDTLEVPEIPAQEELPEPSETDHSDFHSSILFSVGDFVPASDADDATDGSVTPLAEVYKQTPIRTFFVYRRIYVGYSLTAELTIISSSIIFSYFSFLSETAGEPTSDELMEGVVLGVVVGIAICASLRWRVGVSSAVLYH